MFNLIKEFEGFREKAYKCPAGIWTIGYGSTFYEDGAKVAEGDTITKEKAENLVKWYCENKITLPHGDFSENQKEALFSLIYNIGQAAFNKSNCKKFIEEKNWKKAYESWDWVKAGGEVLSGLVKRRNKERKLFFEGLLE